MYAYDLIFYLRKMHMLSGRVGWGGAGGLPFSCLKCSCMTVLGRNLCLIKILWTVLKNKN